MHPDLEAVREKLGKQPFTDKLVCVVLFGSSTRRIDPPKDTDICIVLKDADIDRDSLSRFIFDNFKNPDYTIYTEEEVNSSLPFVDVGNGVFALEYLARGHCIFGRNIFSEKLRAMDPEAYKESLLRKAFEYILRLRIVLFSEAHDSDYKFNYFQKYVTRLARMVLLYQGYASYDNIDSFTRMELLKFAEQKKILSLPGADDPTLENYIRIFEDIDRYVVNIRASEPAFGPEIAVPVRNFLNGEEYRMLGGEAIVFTTEDLNDIVRVCSQENCYNAVFRRRLQGRPYTLANAISFANWVKEGWENHTHFAFIVRNQEGKFAGTLDIKSSNLERAEIGYWSDELQSGFMTNAVLQLIQASKNAGYKSLYARVKEENVRSAQVLLRADFVETSKKMRPDGIIESIFEFDLQRVGLPHSDFMPDSPKAVY